MKKSHNYLIFYHLSFVIMILWNIDLSAQHSLIIKPGPDDGQFAYLNSSAGYGSPAATSLLATAWTYGGIPGTGRSFFKFELPEIPAGATNLRAHLNLYYNPQSAHIGHFGLNSWKIERITSDWSESELTWMNQPPTDIMNGILFGPSDSSNQDYTNIDVTQFVEAMYRDSVENYGLRISLLTEEVYRSVVFASCNHTDTNLRPSLVIDYDACQLPANQFSYNTDGLQCHFLYADSTTSKWLWSFGDGTESDLQNPTHTYTESGSYPVSLVSGNPCGQTTITDTVVVCLLPVASFSFRLQDQAASFINLSIGGEVWYWSFGNGFFSNLENPVYHYLQPGDYRVCLLVSNHCGSDIMCKPLLVEMPVTSQPGQQPAVSTSPNPTRGAVKIDAVDKTICKIDICNSSGLLIKSIGEIDAEEFNIDLSDVDSGIYMVKITTSDGEVTKMIVKE